MKSYSIDKPQIATELYSTMNIYSSITSYIVVEYVDYMRHMKTYVKVDKQNWRGYWTWWKSKKYWNVLKPNPLQYPCLENPMDRGELAKVHRVTKIRTWLLHRVKKSKEYIYKILHMYIYIQNLLFVFHLNILNNAIEQ